MNVGTISDLALIKLIYDHDNTCDNERHDGKELEREEGGERAEASSHVWPLRHVP